MSVSILEALQNAKMNIDTGMRIPVILEIAKAQLDNAVELLEKGYPLDAQVEPLIEEYGDIDSVPEYQK